MKDLVVLKGQKAVTTSLRVADVFRKRHDNVLEAIRGLLKNKGTQQMFEESSRFLKRLPVKVTLTSCLGMHILRMQGILT